ncbi:PREDICTED: tRNA-splicing endonuclease subunit Sen34 [Dufourea novaeangliae]|uniref:tRNA-splicing endonuclease subunit Sen34 n=1 Tax=Dufourea novaeangliae TaxID=178035 RepID=A0A154PDJ4_DUFNO|nr:PREDICTED: tRNA-splicing endonuclease subunit Sen34 [Dufourea novaeangliae]KZC09901.1 tRNA-splicing endonuclease subunit Sen34 [Dufourea novaeangliae]
MIDLISSRSNVFVWSAEDWLKLRRDHRIVGELIGCLPKKPRQDILSGLPLLLQPEEVSLLLEKNFAQLVHFPCLQKPPTESLKQAFEEYRNTLFVEQKECLRNERKKQVIGMMDKIIEGKKRKILGIQTGKKKIKKSLDPKVQEALNNIEINRQQLLEEEMAKLPTLDKTEALIQTHTVYPWVDKDDVEIVEWKYPSNSKEQLRYNTYKDLWERGYYVTSGEKFGGDFLVYPGDPVMFHSQFIVQCKDRDEEIPITELSAQCRIACHVRKTRVYAFFSKDKNNVVYQSFQWAESSVLENG